MAASQRVFIQEVAPRDGLQIEPGWIAIDDKVALIDELSHAGLSKIEVSSVVSAKAVPNLRDADEVFHRIVRHPDVTYIALVPNLKGALRAVAAKADEINFVMSASETHNRANMRMSCEQFLAALTEAAAAIRDMPVAMNATVATAFGCPFEGPQAPEKVLAYVDRYLSAGAKSITLADTTGMANPRQVADMVERFLLRFSGTELTLHFHNTRGLGLANICAAFDSGAVRFDASLKRARRLPVRSRRDGQRLHGRRRAHVRSDGGAVQRQPGSTAYPLERSFDIAGTRRPGPSGEGRPLL